MKRGFYRRAAQNEYEPFQLVVKPAKIIFCCFVKLSD